MYGDILQKRIDESDLQHHRRLVYGKLVDKSLSDFDYSELAQYVYNQEYSPDVARRMMYGSKRTLDMIDRDITESSLDYELLNSIEEQKKELRKERQRFYDQRREFNKQLTNDARAEHLESELIRAADGLSASIGNIFSDSCLAGDMSDTEAVLVFSDWHYGMVADNLYNKYNTDICRARVKYVVESALERIMLHKCNKLHVFMIGDVIHGGIHCSARVASEELVVDQLMQVSEIIAQAIGYLSNYVGEVYVYTTYGNHGRVIQSKKDSIHEDNIERIVGWWLEQRLSDNDRVIVMPYSGNEFLLANVCGHGVCASHGDLDFVRSSPKLIYTLFKKKYELDVDCIILGDKHHRESFEELGITAMICGALCGTDDFAKDRRLFSTPSQLLLIFNRDGLDAEYRLSCE